MKNILIDVLSDEGCKSAQPTIEFIKSIAAEIGIIVKVQETIIKTKEEAKEHKYYGSPTVQIAGLDIYPDIRNSTNYGLGWRYYGASGMPEKETIIKAIKEAKEKTS